MLPLIEFLLHLPSHTSVNKTPVQSGWVWGIGIAIYFLTWDAKITLPGKIKSPIRWVLICGYWSTLHKLLRFLSKARGSESTEQGQVSEKGNIPFSIMKPFTCGARVPAGAGLHPGLASPPALPFKPLNLSVWHLSVIPRYKLPESLETIRSPLFPQGKSFLFPSRSVQLGSEEGGRKPFSSHGAGNGWKDKRTGAITNTRR